eukprot:CAMPEP_0203686124 /NCGR_PEP_ID=MMETSP0090-20130426/48900_1 /ASSEMBLY_ACC=CAM_ASM_001088 /TAXON_ID=426623 /ORGANISM="Chaetoceros affinis, Strain CCMP159" /LENGTH=151 /DNA_ID=CAMNT_0050555341 /DNA_START=518 /DNA_END=973 /DNA_ORIENTATION=+
MAQTFFPNPMAATRFFVEALPTKKTAPMSAPSIVREGVPDHKFQIPFPPVMSALVASSGSSVVAVTRHLIFSRAVPPEMSDATRRNAPRARFLMIGLLSGLMLDSVDAYEHNCTSRSLIVDNDADDDGDDAVLTAPTSQSLLSSNKYDPSS